MKTLSERQIQRWATDWIRENRPGEVRPFWLTTMLLAFQAELEMTNDATEKGNKPENG